MKNLDRLFILLLIFVPLISVAVLVIALNSRKNVTPDDSAAATPTPVYEILPVTTTVAVPTTTYAMANPTNLPTVKPSANPTTIPKQTDLPNPTATSTITQTPAPTKISGNVSIPSGEFDNTTPQTAQTDAAMIVLTAIIIAFSFGGLVAFGSMIRKGK